MEDMIGHCAVVVFISGPTSNRSPACLRELMVATEKNVPIIYAQYQSGQLPRSLESYLYKKKVIFFYEYYGCHRRSRIESAWETVCPKFVELMHM